MSSIPLAPRRESFLAGSTDPRNAFEHRMLDVLLAQDGSTTRLCETIAGGPVELHLVRQHVTGDVPDSVRQRLPGHAFIERITFLAAHGQVMMDNLAYIAMAGLEPDIEADLRAGKLPIGHLLARLWVRRATMTGAAELARQLWDVVGLPDAVATRAYCIVTPEAPRMVIVETYRRGMMMERHEAKAG